MVLRGIHAVLWARAFDSAFGAVGLVIIARTLTPEDLGYFVFFVSAAILAQEFTGEGLEAALVRFRSAGALDDPTAKAVRQLKLGVGALVALGLWIAASVVAGVTKADPGYRIAVGCAGLFALSLTEVRYLFAALQRDRQFYRYALVVPIVGAVKLLLVVVAASVSAAHPYGFYLAFMLAPAATFCLVARLWRMPVRVPLARVTDYRPIVSYAIWISGSTMLFLLMQRAEIFLISAVLTPADVGRYGLALLLVSGIDYVTVAIKAVLLPFVTQARRAAQVLGKLRLAIMVSAAVLVVLLIPYYYLDAILALLVPQKAAGVAPLIRPLFWAAVVSLWLDPLLLWLYREDQPVILTAANATALAVAVSLNLWLLPRWGVEAAAYIHLLSRVVSRAIQVGYQGWIVTTRRAEGVVV
ncbi:MAG: oligosaccharide flippase family protein [Acidobacteria bacterium]|nr:oligosaccharide flippase family protein [Acidobacteriota bacterium]